MKKKNIISLAGVVALLMGLGFMNAHVMTASGYRPVIAVLIRHIKFASNRRAPRTRRSSGATMRASWLRCRM